MTNALEFTFEQFRQATESTTADAQKYYLFIKDLCKQYDLTTKLRLCAFMAQIGHESTGLAVLVENLNYSTKGLLETWPSRFKTLAQAQPYHRNPEKIANVVYSGRMGNGTEQTGEGWKYRGRGLKQLTGKNNYKALTNALNVDFVAKPELLEQPEFAVKSAMWFWSSNNCNNYADKGDIEGLTRKINGGTVGLAERIRRYKLALSVFKQYS
jgi:putative chitinase